MHVSRDGTGRGLVAVDVNVPIKCGGVAVRPGDIVVADTDGVVIIPLEVADKVAELGEAQGKLEDLARELGLEGKPIDDSYMPLVEHVEARGYGKWLDVVTRYDGGQYRATHGENWRKIHGEG